MKKNKNSSKKRKFSFNAVDAAIILIVIALVAFVVYFFALGRDFSEKEDDTSSDLTSDVVDYDTEEIVPSESNANAFYEKLEISF